MILSSGEGGGGPENGGEADAETLVLVLGEEAVGNGHGRGIGQSAERAESGILHILDQRFGHGIGQRQGELSGEFGQQVRMQGRAVCGGELGDAEEGGDSADAHDVGLHDLRGACAEEVI